MKKQIFTLAIFAFTAVPAQIYTLTGLISGPLPIL